MFLRLIMVRLMIACFIAVCCLLMPITSHSARADATTDVQQKLQAIYDAQDAAIVQHDIDNTMVPYADDALFIDNVTATESAGLAGERKGWLDLFQSPSGKVTSSSRQIKEFTLSKTHKSATFLIVHRIGMSVTARSSKVVPVEVDEQIRHYWVKEKMAGRLSRSASCPLTHTAMGNSCGTIVNLLNNERGVSGLLCLTPLPHTGILGAT